MNKESNEMIPVRKLNRPWESVESDGSLKRWSVPDSFLPIQSEVPVVSERRMVHTQEK
jgi:hypothetical protein